MALDAGAMATAATALVGEHDFAAFRAADADPVRSTTRRVLVSEVELEDDLLVYRIEATAFLKHMVRNIVGTLTEIGRGERPVSAISDVLAGRTAPAHGLVLVAVRY